MSRPDPRSHVDALDPRAVVIGVLAVAVAAGVACGVIAVAARALLGAAVRVSLLCLAAGALLLVLELLRGAIPAAAPLVPARVAAAVAPVAELERLETVVGFACAEAGDLHALLRPMLRAVAVQRLRRRGVVPDTGEARRLLGEEAWSLLRPDRSEPVDRHAPGIDPARLERILATLEAL